VHLMSDRIKREKRAHYRQVGKRRITRRSLDIYFVSDEESPKIMITTKR